MFIRHIQIETLLSMNISKSLHSYTEAMLSISKSSAGQDAQKNLQQIHDQLSSISAIIDQLNHQYNQRLFNEKIGQDMLISSFGKLKLSKPVMNLMIKLTKKKQLNLIPSICKYLPSLELKEKGIVPAVVFSAKALKKTEEQDIINYVQENCNKQIQVTNIVDESLLGGVKLSFDSFLIDASLLAKLDKAKVSLSKSIKI